MSHMNLTIYIKTMLLVFTIVYSLGLEANNEHTDSVVNNESNVIVHEEPAPAKLEAVDSQNVEATVKSIPKHFYNLKKWLDTNGAKVVNVEKWNLKGEFNGLLSRGSIEGSGKEYSGTRSFYEVYFANNFVSDAHTELVRLMADDNNFLQASYKDGWAAPWKKDQSKLSDDLLDYFDNKVTVAEKSEIEKRLAEFDRLKQELRNALDFSNKNIFDLDQKEKDIVEMFSEKAQNIFVRREVFVSDHNMVGTKDTFGRDPYFFVDESGKRINDKYVIRRGWETDLQETVIY